MHLLRIIGICIVWMTFLHSTTGFAQVNRCATVEYTQMMEAAYAGLHDQLQAAKLEALDWEHTHYAEGSRIVITIPVVVHIMHAGVAIGTYPNITDAQVMSQIDVLNKDFRKLNSDTNLVPAVWKSIAADCEIQFCLATVDPSGNPTTGIDRVDRGAGYTWTSANQATSKSSTIWNRNNYLNLWVVEFGTGYTSTLGYAIGPGGPATSDGVVIDAKYFGTSGTVVSPYNKGRTATHEIGHWLGLDHIWGDDGTACSGTDGISDTPNQAGQNFGCPTYPKTDACTGSSPGVMFMNYMDYTDDGCMYMFTAGQKARMVSVLNSTRASIKTSTACGSVATIAVSGTVVDAVSGTAVPNAKVLFTGTSEVAVTANASGNFTANVVSGTYDVYAGKWGYMTKQYTTGASYTSATSGITIPINNNKYYDDYTLDLGWTTASTATSGNWTRTIPVEATNGSDISQTGADVVPDFTDKCYVTGNGAAGGGAGAADVDGGIVTLTSPSFNLSGFGNPYIKCYVWFYNGGGTGTPNDYTKLKISNGSTTVDVKNITYTGSENNWVYTLIPVKDFITLSSTMNFIVETEDVAAGHLVEAAIDRFEIVDSFAQNIGSNYESAFTIFPNPATSQVNVQFDTRYNAINTVKVFNALSEVVYETEVIPSESIQQIEIPVSAWQAGVYYLVGYGEKNQTRGVRFIKY